MNIDEELAENRYVYFMVYDSDGEPVADATGSFTLAELKVSRNGAAAIQAPGTLHAVGGGLHYYAATPADAAVPGFLWVRLDADNGGNPRFGEGGTTIGQTFKLGETDTTMLRNAFTMYDSNGALVSGVQSDGGLSVLKYLNGAAAGAASGSLAAVTGLSGLYYYQGTVAEASVEGALALKISSGISRTQIVVIPVATESGNVNPDPPVVVVVSPTPGAAPGTPGGFPASRKAAEVTPVVLRIYDVIPGIRLAVITVTVPRVVSGATYMVEEVVYRNGQFRGIHVANSTQRTFTQSIDGEDVTVVELSVRRAGGWPEVTSLKFSVDVVDQSGNLGG